MKESTKKQIEAFHCKTCNKFIDLGQCGEHREETGHKEFEIIVDVKKINKMLYHDDKP